MKNLRLTLILICCSFNLAIAQGTSAKFEYRSLIDMPTAGVLEKGFAAVTLDVMPFGVLISKIEVGVFEGFGFGISYGGSNIIGSGKVSWYKLPSVNVRARFADEDQALPAITFGFDSQGKGSYDKKLNRFEIKSPGFFLAVSKNFEFFGYLSLHAVMNYSLERDDADKDLNMGFGFEKTLGGKISFIGQYDFGINDNTGSALGKGNGYLNLGMRWTVGEGLTLGIDLRNMLKNKKISGNIADRGIFVEYLKAIF